MAALNNNLLSGKEIVDRNRIILLNAAERRVVEKTSHRGDDYHGYLLMVMVILVIGGYLWLLVTLRNNFNR